MDATSGEFTVPDLEQEVLSLIRQIPAGSVSTYGDLARALGDPQVRAARWIGEFLAHHPHACDCPCHRVVRANGQLGLFVTGDVHAKARLLQQEGVAVTSAGQVDLQTYQFHDFVSGHPLQALKALQLGWASQSVETPLPGKPRTFAAVDVAYSADGRACAAYVLLQAETLECLATLTISQPALFPYIPGYLTFRELPPMLAVCRQAQAKGLMGEILFCDGNGRLHPWGAGIATCLGVCLDWPVIGVGKSLLCGRVSQTADTTPDTQPVMDQGKVIAQALTLKAGTRPVYVSVGNRITLNQAVQCTRQATLNRRLPEPIFLADRLSKQAKQ
jgi:deoxyribonuclease V